MKWTLTKGLLLRFNFIITFKLSCYFEEVQFNYSFFTPVSITRFKALKMETASFIPLFFGDKDIVNSVLKRTNY